MKSANERISDIFGDDVEHLHGNLFRAKRSKIKLAKPGLTVKGGKLVYGNPRWFINKDGEQEAKGIEKGKMDELRSSIQDEGLENPIRLRVNENGKKSYLEVINGERRFRCLEELCERDVPCFHPESGEQVSASELYEWVDCRIEFMDDEMALRCALRPNETSEVIGDVASINVVKTLRSSGFDDQEILKATGKSISWLRETDKIISLDEVCLEHFQEDKINRKVALHLASVEDAEERIALLEKFNESAMSRHAEKLKQVDAKISKAKMEHECQSAASELAQEEGDEDSAKEHADLASKAKQKMESGAKERKKIANSGVTATSKDIENVNKKEGKAAKPLSHKKIQSDYINLIQQIMDAEGIDENGDSLGINLEILHAVHCVLFEIMSGNRDAMTVFTEHCPLVFDETEESDDEESSNDEEESSDEEISDENEGEISDENEGDDDEDDEDDEDEDYEDEEDDRVDDSYEPSEDDLREFQASKGVRDMDDDE